MRPIFLILVAIHVFQVSQIAGVEWIKSLGEWAAIACHFSAWVAFAQECRKPGK